MNSEVTRVRPASSWGATALACALVGAGAAAGVMTSNGVAQAADVNVVTDASIKNTTHPNGPNNVFDSFNAVFSFDTTGKTVAENDTLTIKLPKELRTRQASFDVTDAQTGGVALRCSVPSGEGPELTCVFTDYMKTHENAKGQIHLVGDTAAESSSENLNFTVNHTVTLPVPMPNGKIVPKSNAHAPAKAYKDGWQLHNGHDERFTWEVYIPERQNHASTISVTDTFDPANGGYRLFNDPNGAWQRTRLLKWNSLEDFQNDPKRENFAEKVDVGGSINGGSFTMTETADGFVASFPNSGGDAYYLLKYYTELKVPASASVGSAFKNTAVVNDQVAEKSIVINTAGWGDVDADKKKTPTPTPSTTTPEPTPSTTTPEPEPTPSTTTPEPEPTRQRQLLSLSPPRRPRRLSLPPTLSRLRQRQLLSPSPPRRPRRLSLSPPRRRLLPNRLHPPRVQSLNLPRLPRLLSPNQVFQHRVKLLRSWLVRVQVQRLFLLPVPWLARWAQ